MPCDAVDFGSSTPFEGRWDAYESRASSWPLAATKTSLSRMSGIVRRSLSPSRAARASSAVEGPEGVMARAERAVARGASGSAGEPGPAPANPGAYSYAILFQADGTADQDAEIVFQMHNAASVSLCLRAMTGAVTLKTQSSGGR